MKNNNPLPVPIKIGSSEARREFEITALEFSLASGKSSKNSSAIIPPTVIFCKKDKNLLFSLFKTKERLAPKIVARIVPKNEKMNIQIMIYIIRIYEVKTNYLLLF